MASGTRTDSKIGTLTLVRRSLEVRWGWRALFAVIPAAIGSAIVTRSLASAIAGVVLFALAVAILSLPLFSPERTRRRLLAAASERVPDADGWVTLVGVAAEAGELLSAPYSKRACVAYWARAVSADTEDDTRDAGTDSEQYAESCDFALEVGDVRLLVAGADAELAFDRNNGEVVLSTADAVQVERVSRAHRGRDRNEEIILRVGERVVVRGMLVRDGSGTPYRATARIVADRRRPVKIVLGASV